MKVIIQNQHFAYNDGVRLLKMKYGTCPADMKQLADMWDDIQPLTFGEIAKFENLEQRRIGMSFLGIDNLVKQVKPELVNEQTIKKTTSYIDSKGEFITKKFNDTYKLFKVSGSYLAKGLDSWQSKRVSETDFYYVECKDTSTDRNYLIWVDLGSVFDTNYDQHERFRANSEAEVVSKINAIQCVAWTIQTNLEKGSIDHILRQGDCILIKPTKDAKTLQNARHLTEEEYRTLLVAES